MTKSYDIGVVYDLETDLGIQTVVGIDYKSACDLVHTTIGRSGNVYEVNGAVELEPIRNLPLTEDESIAAHLVSHTLFGQCLNYVRTLVPDPDEWEWAKVNVTGEDIAGISCLDINHGNQEAIVISL